MFKEYKRPFDREDIFKDKVKILVKLDTFKIITDEEKDIIERLILLERLRCFRVLFILSENEALNQIVKENDGEIVTYYNKDINRPMVVMKTNKSHRGQDLIYGTYDDFKYIKQSNSNISVLESFLIDVLKIDYVVTCNKDNYFTDNKNAKNIDLNNLIDEIRILLVNRGIYKKYINSTVNQGLYYEHRIQSVFPYYSMLRYYTNSLDSENYQEVKEQTYSLSQRLGFLCKASDRISYYYFKKPNNDNRDECLYNFAYFIMLATGIFDDFAWILNRVYRLGLRDMDIKLRCVYKNNEFLNSTFIKKLMNKNIELSRILKNQNLQNDINVLYPIRDTIQHREFIISMGHSKVLGNKTIEKESIIVIPKESIEFIKRSNIGTLEQWGVEFEIGNRNCINPQLFTEQILHLINKISKYIVEGIEWGEFLNNKDLERIEIEINKLKSGQLKTLTFANDTLYFGRINTIKENN